MSKFKVGDLALVIKSLDKEKVGRSVAILDVLTDSCTSYVYRGSIHIGSADGSLSAFVDFGEEDGIRLYDQNWLIPLRGDFQPEQQKAKEVEA